jgi:hypothetical protein
VSFPETYDTFSGICGHYSSGAATVHLNTDNSLTLTLGYSTDFIHLTKI